MYCLSPAWMAGTSEQEGIRPMPGGAGNADNVIDLLEWRANRRPDPIPSEVIAELDAAARVYDTLLAQGHELRFDLPERAGERVRAELRSLDGAVVRRVALAEVVGCDDQPAA
jgi:hypothetical protein